MGDENTTPAAPTVVVQPEPAPSIDPVTERIVKLETDVKGFRDDLQREISDTRSSLSQEISTVRTDVDRTIADRFGTIEGKLGSIEEKLSKPQSKEASGEQPTPSTNVEQVMQRDELTRITTNPTEINPPPLPVGIRGRRHARRTA